MRLIISGTPTSETAALGRHAHGSHGVAPDSGTISEPEASGEAGEQAPGVVAFYAP